MKLSANNLEQQLNKNRLPLYWIAGEEALLVQESCDKIRQCAKNNGFENKIIFHLESNFNWNLFVAETENLSLLSELTLIELRLGEKKLSEAGKKILANYLLSPATDKLILLISTKIDTATQKTKWFEAIEKNSGFVPIWPLSTSELSRWIENYLKNQQLSASKEIIQLLMDAGEGNLLAIKQNIEKLKLLYPQGVLKLDEVTAAISDDSRFDIFSLIDAALEKNSSRVVKILKNLRQEGTEPILILWAITREVRTILTLLEKKEDIGELTLKKLGIWPKRMPLIKKEIQSAVPMHYEQLLLECNTLDKLIKGVEAGNVWDSLERVGLQLAGIHL